MNNKGQSLVAELIVWGLGFLIFIFAMPILLETIGISVTGNNPISFVVKLFPWFILLLLVGRIYRIIVTGGRL